MRALGVDEARAIHRAHYWNAVHGDELPAGIDLAVFDAAVNSGRRRAALWLQEALGVAADGAIGPRTLRAARATNDRAALIGRVCDIRVAFLRGLDTWPDFGRGWSRRVRSVRQVAARNALLDALLVDIAAGITSNRTLGGAVEWAAPGAPTIDDVEFEGAAPARAASIPVTLFYTVAGSPLA